MASGIEIWSSYSKTAPRVIPSLVDIVKVTIMFASHVALVVYLTYVGFSAQVGEPIIL